MIKGTITINIELNYIQIVILTIVFVLFCTNFPAWLVYFRFHKYLENKKKVD